MSVVRGVAGDMRPLTELAREAEAVIYESEAVILHANQNRLDAAQAEEAVLNALFEGVKGTNKPFVYTSGVAFIGDTGGRIVDENTPVNAEGPLAWRWRHEQRVLDPAIGIRGVALRPSLVHGRYGGGLMLMNMLASAKGRGDATFVGDGNNRWCTIHVDELADLFVRAVEQAPKGTVLFAASLETVRLKDAAEAASHAMGAGGKTKSIPFEQARQTLGPVAAMNIANITVSGARAQSVVDWKPSQPH